MAKDGGGGGKDGSSASSTPARRTPASAHAPVRPASTASSTSASTARRRTSRRSNNAPFNWSYGYAVSLGGSFMLDTSHWSPGSNLDVWTNTAFQTLEPSVFHNSGLSQQMYAGDDDPRRRARALSRRERRGLDRALDGAGQGLLRDRRDVHGDLGALDHGEHRGPRQQHHGDGDRARPSTSSADGNTFTYSAPAQTLVPGDVVDFYVTTVFNRRRFRRGRHARRAHHRRVSVDSGDRCFLRRGRFTGLGQVSSQRRAQSGAASPWS